jgi:transposase
MTLAHSRKAVRLLVWKSSTKIWAQLHERAFRRLGGATATVVLDNLREGVIAPDVYDPLLHQSRQCRRRYGGSQSGVCSTRPPVSSSTRSGKQRRARSVAAGDESFGTFHRDMSPR